MILDLTRLNSVSESQFGELPVLEINNASCSGTISLFGGHILSFKPKHDQRERLWLSDTAITDKSKPIRGGIPICWPWFANIFPSVQTPNEQLPAHGFVRTQDWLLVDATENDSSTRLVLQPKKLGLYAFSASLRVCLEVTFGAELTVKLITTYDKNEDVQAKVASAQAPLAITMALHSYLAVSDINKCELVGVEADYIDKLANDSITTTPSPYIFDQEVDRIHMSTQSAPLHTVSVNDAKTTTLKQQGHDALVVWNPWIDKSSGMADMQHDGYKSMLCVEAAVVNPITLNYGEKHELIQTIS
ncbi:D-hexose-6-phosphate mutarotase [Glaciecola sp. MH2013]|uniref:D-hexose-6-phosphate mutarotase n=1 Tax=Glaciecola sp. MH2013 TaxID=2785524 RepID=UPI00189FAB8C|nr:D-hexose-6-phosphate mutarotase [Glaciecola sp. MH2013]MBF7072600.1 D-hexose-6-phosphate mutarotase [Glaciecola sp. MH2013]